MENETFSPLHPAQLVHICEGEWEEERGEEEGRRREESRGEGRKLRTGSCKSKEANLHEGQLFLSLEKRAVLGAVDCLVAPMMFACIYRTLD